MGKEQFVEGLCATIQSIMQATIKHLFLILTLLLSLIAYGINANNVSGYSESQMQFIQFIVPKINSINLKVAAQREKVLNLYSIWLEGDRLGSGEQKWLENLAENYQIKDADFSTEEAWNNLLRHVDVIPNSLVLAQAINESAWGRSYFAKEGNNYFGQWCLMPGCGLVPRRRPKGATYEVRKFPTPSASVESYMHNLNSRRGYEKLRELRQNLRLEDKQLDSLILAGGLEHYSQRGSKYITILQNIINEFNLQQFDSQF